MLLDLNADYTYSFHCNSLESCRLGFKKVLYSISIKNSTELIEIDQRNSEGPCYYP